MLRKIFGIMVLLIFALSIVQVMADEDVSVEIETEVESENGSQKAETQTEIRIKARERLQENRERAREIIEERRERVEQRIENLEDREGRNEFIRAKAQIQVDMNKALAEYQRAKGKFLEARTKHLEQKERVQELREEVKRCNEDESPECKEKREQVRQGLRVHLENTLSVMEESVTQLEAKINASESMTVEQKAASLTTLANIQAEISQETSDVQALNATSPKEEYNQAIKNVKSLWDKVRLEQKKIIAIFVSGKLDLIVEKDNQYLESMEQRIEQLKTQGLDTAKLEEIKAEFVAQIAASKETVASAQTSISSAATGKELNDVWKEIHKEVKDDVKETKDLLREFVKTTRDLRVDIGLEIEAQANVTASS